jgi:hypothetical protein
MTVDLGSMVTIRPEIAHWGLLAGSIGGAVGIPG